MAIVIDFTGKSGAHSQQIRGQNLHFEQTLIIFDLPVVMCDSKLEKMVKDVSRHFALRKCTSAQSKLYQGCIHYCATSAVGK